MITVTAKVFEHHQKEDGTWNVKICVYHQGVRRYVETTHFVSKQSAGLCLHHCKQTKMLHRLATIN